MKKSRQTPSQPQSKQQRLIELKALEVEVNEHSDKQISQTDPDDARLMKTRHMERQVCYYVQTAVDTKHYLIHPS
jgi:hypothetical protein